MDHAILQKWEYMVEEINTLSSLRQTLVQAGNEGWELVNVTRGAGAESSTPVKSLRVRKESPYCVFLKRPGD